MNIVLIGPPACGKGTQAKLIEKEFNVVHISTGDLLRSIVNEKSELSSLIQENMNQGRFVPDGLIIELLENHLSKIDKKNGILFDGFPRTISQARELQKIIQIDYIIEIKVSMNSLIQRVCNRLICPNCGRIYNQLQHESELCDVCGVRLKKRSDDTREIAESRYRDYCELTYPIVEYYKNFKGYFSVDGEKTTEEVFSQICGVIRSKK